MTYRPRRWVSRYDHRQACQLWCGEARGHSAVLEVERKCASGSSMGCAPESQVRSRLVWGFSCQAVVLGCADSFLFGAGKAVFRPVACNQVPGARGRGQGTETLAELGGLPPSVACVSQRLDA